MSTMKAADDVKNFAKKLKPILELAEVLESIGSLENAKQEAVKAHEKAKADAQKASDDLALGLINLDKVQAQVEEAKSLAEAIVKQAYDKAAEIAALSNKQVSEGQRQLNVYKTSIVNEIESAKKELAELAKEISNKKSEIELVKKEAQEFKSKFLSIVK